MNFLKKLKKGYISVEYVIIGVICLVGVAATMPVVKGYIQRDSNLTVNSINAYEKKVGVNVINNPSNIGPINPDSWQPGVNDPTTTTSTKKLYFENAFFTVNVDDMISISPTRVPETVTYPTLKWSIVSGGEHAVVIESANTQSLEITGSRPGRITIQVESTDGTGKIAYAYIDVVRNPETIKLVDTDMVTPKNSITMKVGNGATTTDRNQVVYAIVGPDDVSDKSVTWAFKNSNGSECLDISTVKNKLILQSKKPAGLSCDKTIQLTATAYNGISTTLTVEMKDLG